MMRRISQPLRSENTTDQNKNQILQRQRPHGYVGQQPLPYSPISVLLLEFSPFSIHSDNQIARGALSFHAASGMETQPKQNRIRCNFKRKNNQFCGVCPDVFGDGESAKKLKNTRTTDKQNRCRLPVGRWVSQFFLGQAPVDAIRDKSGKYSNPK